METKSGSISILVTVEARIVGSPMLMRERVDVTGGLAAEAEAMLLPVLHHLAALFDQCDLIEIRPVGLVLEDGRDHVAQA